ncbi:hypothetical protein KJ359_007727 [Pestalotiopsis sp. 9143b]|nr:hypothetical protein KJ359_007727 [Pestalotiopsis sp. 9143b]
MAWLTLLLLFLFDVPLAGGSSFISPTYQGTTDTGRFSESSVWELGSSQLVAFQTDFDAYWIELWQQNLVQAKATLASTRIYTQESGQDLAQSFYWTVQTYDINFTTSPTTAVAGTVTPGADSGTSDTANKETNEPSSTLSTGATVGIAVGASVVGLAGLVWAGIFCWTRRRKRDEGISRSEQTASWAHYRTVPPPVEMGLAQHGEAVEIGDSYR